MTPIVITIKVSIKSTIHYFKARPLHKMLRPVIKRLALKYYKLVHDDILTRHNVATRSVPLYYQVPC